MTKRIQRVLEGSPVPLAELRFVRVDGTPIDVEVAALPTLYEGQKAAYVVARDLTERRRLELRVQQTQKLESLGLLAGGIAHDFNNLLVGILGNAELALDDLPEGPASESMRNVVRAAQRAAELTGQLLAYAGRARFEPTLVDLSDLVEEMTGLLEVTIPRNATLVPELGEGLPLVEGDPSQLGQVVLNLPGARPGGGARDRPGPRRRRHGSQRPRHGTTFRVLLAPSVRPEPVPAPSSRPPETGAEAIGTVLLVDDEPSVRAVGRAALERSGFRVLEAVDGADAVEVFAAQAREIDLVLLDMTMPELGGDETLGRLRRLRPGIPVLLLSGWAEEDTQQRIGAERPDGFLQKPYRPSELVARVRKLMLA